MGVESWPTGRPLVSHASEPTRPRAGGRPDADYFAGAPAAGSARAPSRSNGQLSGDTTSVPAPSARSLASARHRADRTDVPRRGGGPLGDRRGLTAAGALVLLIVLGGIGALVDRALGHGLWIFFSVGFVAAVLLSSLRIHLEDLFASIVMVPLAYGAIGIGSGLIEELGSSSGLRQEATSAAGVLVFGTPILLLSIAVAVVIAAARARAAMVARRRARARAARRFGDVPPGARPRHRSAGGGAVR
jgi:hypothetical protein